MAKNVIFGTLYGMGHRALADQNNVNAEDVKDYMKYIKDQYTVACGYMEHLQRLALSQVGRELSPVSCHRLLRIFVCRS